MSRRSLAAALVLGALVSGCQSQEIEVEAGDRAAAELFNDRCSGCHTLSVAAAHGSKPEGQVDGGDRTNGPNFDTRPMEADDVLFAIRNGGFSGAIMPANIVVGEEAQAVAEFLAEYSGTEAETGGEPNDEASNAGN